MTSEWRVLAMIATSLDARAGLRLTRSKRTMAADELAAIRRLLEAVPAAVATWSEGNAAMPRFDVVVLDEPIRSLTASSPGQFWVAPNDVHAAIDRHAPRGAYDSIICAWPTDGSFGLCGWGCSRGPTDESNGAGFSSIISDDWRAHVNRLFPEEGFVHEWLHQVEAVYRGLGLGEPALPSLHDVDGRTSARGRDVAPFGRLYPDYERETGTWQPWYRDLMTGTVGLKGTERPPVGLTPERWALRTNPPPDDPDLRPPTRRSAPP